MPIRRKTHTCLAAVVGHLTAEVLELAGKAASDNKKLRVISRHVELAMRKVEELKKLLFGVSVAQGPTSVILPKKSQIVYLMKPLYRKRNNGAFHNQPHPQRGVSDTHCFRVVLSSALLLFRPPHHRFLPYHILISMFC